MTNISINNSLSIRGHVVSLQFASNRGSFYADHGTTQSVMDSQLLDLATKGAVHELKAAVGESNGLLGEELTLRDVDATVKLPIWHSLGITVEAEFQLVTTGHGVIEDGQHVKLLVKTPAKEVA